jgi:hypothetical protein
MITTADALHSLKPNAQWVLRGDELEWLDLEQTEPTKAELAKEVTKLQADYDAKVYQRDRAEAYPSIVDQLDDIYHNGVDEWKKTIKAIKDKYPKE